jgi:hypothetical protein
MIQAYLKNHYRFVGQKNTTHGQQITHACSIAKKILHPANIQYVGQIFLYTNIWHELSYKYDMVKGKVVPCN